MGAGSALSKPPHTSLRHTKLETLRALRLPRSLSTLSPKIPGRSPLTLRSPQAPTYPGSARRPAPRSTGLATINLQYAALPACSTSRVLSLSARDSEGSSVPSLCFSSGSGAHAPRPLALATSCALLPLQCPVRIRADLSVHESG